ncbi:MAG: eCIS core domain-containing protein [Solirubrobacteraceae bacterium]
MDAELEQEVERAGDTPAREVQSPERFGDERGDLQNAASSVGNRGFGQLVARMRDGEGILSGGLVHPDVEAAIAASAGRGQRLAGHVSRSVETAVGAPLDDVRVHTDDHAAALARAVSARAFAVGSDIYFGSGEYNPGTRDGAQLIAHEATHVVQQRGAPRSGPLTVSQPGEPLEREAEAVARGVTA